MNAPIVPHRNRHAKSPSGHPCAVRVVPPHSTPAPRHSGRQPQTLVARMVRAVWDHHAHLALPKLERAALELLFDARLTPRQFAEKYPLAPRRQQERDAYVHAAAYLALCGGPSSERLYGEQPAKRVIGGGR